MVPIVCVCVFWFRQLKVKDEYMWDAITDRKRRKKKRRQQQQQT
jgi:hypothetical protein